MTDANDRAALLTLLRGDDLAKVLADVPDDRSANLFARLLHGILCLYDNAARATRSPLGLIALGSWLTEIAETDPSSDRGLAAGLILSYNAAMSSRDIDRALYAFGADTFNNAIDAADADCRATDLLLAAAGLWRQLMPELHTTDGLAALQTIVPDR